MKKAKRKRFPSGSVCKPCWELKYCPYGPLVELFPIAGQLNPAENEASYRRTLREFTTGKLKTERDVLDAIDGLYANDPQKYEYIRDYPPEEVGCRIFGHVCPVFFTQSGGTETKEGRREGRTIPRGVMLKVVRRDNHVCQICHKYVEDDDMEFDHTIPYSKGGPTTVSNIRLLCSHCNRKKSNSLKELLIDR